MKYVIISTLNNFNIISLTLSTVLSLIFFRLNLEQTSKDSINQFVISNQIEISNGNTLSLASKLNSLLSAKNIVCISGKLNNIYFINYSKGICKFPFFTSNQKYITPNHNQLMINISFTYSIYLFLSILCLIFGQVILLTIQFKLQNDKINKVTAMNKIVDQMAKQVAHDIRSPLSALNMITSSLDEITEDKRSIIKSSIQRINDIANDLLKKGTNTKQITTSEKAQLENSDFLLTSVVESILSEKRVQYKNKINIHISSETSSAYGIFVSINESEFKRVLSNLINNAVEAIADNTGKINLILKKLGNSALIIINDNGPGIPKIILEKLGKESISFGKENSDSGSGLGVLHAKNTIESYGGSFSIQSIHGRGTTITLSIPLSRAPLWFLEKLELSQVETLIVCDDDSSIHSLWKERLSGISNLKILNFSTLKEIERWLSVKENLNSNFKLLIDYEFSNECGDGLNLISKYKLNEKCILVTSLFEEQNIINKCINDDIKQIPKILAGLVPIQTHTETHKIDAVILDDEERQERLWKFSAIQRGKKIAFLKDPDELFNMLSSINSNTPIYIDSKFAVNIMSENIALRLNNLGYKNLHLTTDSQTDEFKHLTFIKSVIGKNPKFE